MSEACSAGSARWAFGLRLPAALLAASIAASSATAAPPAGSTVPAATGAELRTYEDDTLRLDVPVGWLARRATMGGTPGLVLTNIADAELVQIEEARRIVQAGEIIVHIAAVGAMGDRAWEAYGLTADSTGADYVEGYARVFRTAPRGVRATAPTTVHIGDKELAFTEAELDRFQYTLRQYGWEEYGIGVTTHRGEADRFAPLVRTILSSLEKR